MKNRRISLLLSIVAIECVMIAGSFKLAEENVYFWIPVGALGVGLAITSFFFSDSLLKMINNYLSVKNDHDTEVIQNYCEKSEQLIGSLDNLQKEIIKHNESVTKLNGALKDLDSVLSDKIESIVDLQAKQNSKLEGFCNKVESIVSETKINSIAAINEIKESIERISVINKNNNENLSSLLTEINKKSMDESLAQINKLDGAITEHLICFKENNANFYETLKSLIGENYEKNHSLISKGVETIIVMLKNYTQENGEKGEIFKNEISDTFDTKLRELNKIYKDMNRSFVEVKEGISEVLSECKKNTERYEETLNSIFTSQKEANVLTEKDIVLLERLIEEK